MVQYGVEGSSTFLECQARSPHAVIKWHLQRDNSDRRKEVSWLIKPIVFVFTQMHQNPQTTIQTFAQMNMIHIGLWTTVQLQYFSSFWGTEVYMQYDAFEK